MTEDYARWALARCDLLLPPGGEVVREFANAWLDTQVQLQALAAWVQHARAETNRPSDPVSYGQYLMLGHVQKLLQKES